MVHHGGAGTTATAAQAGVPQIIVPFFGDQPFWAQRIFGIQAGPRPIPRRDLSSLRLQQAVTQTLHHPRYAENAHKLGQLLQEEDGVGNAVALIQRFLEV